MNHRLGGLAFLAVAALAATALFAQPKPGAAGHWEGAVDVPGGGPLNFVVDLAQEGKGNWIGDIDIPQQGIKDWLLGDITVRGAEVSFAMKGVPGDPSFKATLAGDGKTMSGNLAQGGGTVPFKLTRTGEANVKLPAKSTALGKEFEGAWAGTLDVSGNALRLVVKLSRAADGAGTGTIDSLDQEAKDIPITTVTQSGSSLKLELKQIGASYEGKLSEDKSELAGEWNQGGGTFPLRLKRAR